MSWTDKGGSPPPKMDAIPYSVIAAHNTSNNWERTRHRERETDRNKETETERSTEKQLAAQVFKKLNSARHAHLSDGRPSVWPLEPRPSPVFLAWRVFVRSLLTPCLLWCGSWALPRVVTLLITPKTNYWTVSAFVSTNLTRGFGNFVQRLSYLLAQTLKNLQQLLMPWVFFADASNTITSAVSLLHIFWFSPVKPFFEGLELTSQHYNLMDGWRMMELDMPPQILWRKSTNKRIDHDRLPSLWGHPRLCSGHWWAHDKCTLLLLLSEAMRFRANPYSVTLLPFFLNLDLNSTRWRFSFSAGSKFKPSF